jgi:copper transport protein
MTVLGAVLGVLAVATPAWGHAMLVETSPADGARLDESPGVIRLVFNEPVDVPVAAVRVFDATGERVDGGDAGHGSDPAEVVVTVPGQPDGAYVVTWRATSADGHPVRGAFVYQVGDGSAAVDETLVASLLGESEGVPFAVAGWLLRWLTYGGALLAAGGAAFLLLVARAESLVVGTLIRRAAVVGIAGSVLQVPVLAAEATGLGLSAVVSAPALAGALTSSVGAAGLVRVAALWVLWRWATLAGPLPRAAGFAGVVLAELLTGHTRTADPAWVAFGADAIHVSGAAVWVGGLAALALLLRSDTGEDPGTTALLVGRFSNVAVWSVAALSAAGLALAWVEVRALSALTSTTYGWTLVAKVAVVVAVIAVAAYNNRVLVPAITRPVPDDAAATVGGSATDTLAPPRVALDRMKRSLSVELAGLALVVAVTALLVNLQPAAEAAGVSGPYSTFVAFGDSQLNVVVDPNRAGRNEIHLYVLTTGGLPALVSGDAEVELSLPAEDIGPIVRPLQVAGPGHYVHIGPELAFAGEWVITVRQRVSQFEERTAEVPVTVRP